MTHFKFKFRQTSAIFISFYHTLRCQRARAGKAYDSRNKKECCTVPLYLYSSSKRIGSYQPLKTKCQMPTSKSSFLQNSLSEPNSNDFCPATKEKQASDHRQIGTSKVKLSYKVFIWIYLYSASVKNILAGMPGKSWCA